MPTAGGRTGPSAAWPGTRPPGSPSRGASRAMRALAAAPADVVPFLVRRLRPAKGPDPKVVQQLVDDLGHKDFATRDRATKELNKLGDLADLALRKALAQNPPLEARR